MVEVYFLAEVKVAVFHSSCAVDETLAVLGGGRIVDREGKSVGDTLAQSVEMIVFSPRELLCMWCKLLAIRKVIVGLLVGR